MYEFLPGGDVLGGAKDLLGGLIGGTKNTSQSNSNVSSTISFNPLIAIGSGSPSNAPGGATSSSSGATQSSSQPDYLPGVGSGTGGYVSPQYVPNTGIARSSAGTPIGVVDTGSSNIWLLVAGGAGLLLLLLSTGKKGK